MKIERIKIQNYKSLCNFTTKFNDDINILVGDNETGKSTILECIDLVVTGSNKKLESIGLNNILNIQEVNKFLTLSSTERTIEKLPILVVELYLQMDDNIMQLFYEGKNNSEGKNCCGIRLICKPNEEYFEEINRIIAEEKSYFPYEYYSCIFDTFAAQFYSKKKNKLKSMWINTLNMYSSYAISDYIKRIYADYTENDIEMRLKLINEINSQKTSYNESVLQELNDKLPNNEEYFFGLQINTSADFSKELTLTNRNDGISLFNHGTGEQIITNTKYTVNNSDNNILLIEEPENHLSYVMLRYMISLINSKNENQIFITTHSSMICAGISLNNLIVLSKEKKDEPLTMEMLDKETSEYFMKAPVVDILKVVLSNKVVLLEGPSEYILFDMFYRKIFNHSYVDDKIEILDIRGLSFKRYLNVIKLLHTKVAIITDNDRFKDNRIECLKKYEQENKVKIFTEKDAQLYTFEIALYEKNKDILSQNGLTLDTMLKDKTDSALKILTDNINVEIPDYIEEAIKWIKN